MSVKEVEVAPIGVVKFYKRRNARSLKIRIDHNNQVRVTLPTWAPYQAGIEFVKSRQDWINKHRTAERVFKTGGRVGKAHRVEFVASVGLLSVRSVVKHQTIQIKLPTGVASSSHAAQIAARRGAVVALRRESAALLPIRLKQLAKQHEFSYSSVQIKHLRSRWGSCNQHREISLNLYLMELPWPLIDYVLLHELTHTQHLSHGSDFWTKLTSCLPNAKQLRTQLRAYHPES